ncbi:hypothetical protein V8C42DRAFT_334620 [Trichoderma barbatum]
MAPRRTARVDQTASNSILYIKYTSEDSNFNKSCTTLHCDNAGGHCSRESDDTISTLFSGYCFVVKHSGDSSQVTLPQEFGSINTYYHIFPFPGIQV